MLHLGPGASRKRVPPSPDVPSGNTLGSITRRSHKSPTACSPRASTKLGSLSLASSGHFHPTRPGGRRFPPPRFRSASPPPASPSTPRRKDAPRPGLRHHVRASHHASGPQEIPSRCARDCASGTSFVSSGRCGSRGHLRALRRQALSSSLPALPRSYRRLCSLVVPAGTLDPAPCGGKEHLSVLRSQNPVFTGFAKHRQSRGEGITTILGCRAKSAGQA